MRWAYKIFLLIVSSAILVGCHSFSRFGPPTPVEAGLNPVELIDPEAQFEADALLDVQALYRISEQLRRELRPEKLPPKRSVLVLSGGGNYGAFSAGIICGWTLTGNRPDFDVVTGISTGALIAPMAFLGPRYDCQLEQFYTTLRNDDLYRIRRPLASLLSPGLASNAPLAEKVDQTVTPALIREIAEEHAKGRRLYVGTTELEARRFVVWDMGEIASRGTPEDVKLFKQILLGSSAIPGFFPPQEIPVTVDGQQYIERHVDGGVSQALFFRPPYDTELSVKESENRLYDSDVYIILAGKLFADPTVVKPRALTIASNSISPLIYAQARGDLMRTYTLCMLTGMNYHMASIPMDFRAPTSSTDFDPVEMRRMFDEGVREIVAGEAWRKTPPGVGPAETPLERFGPRLTRMPGRGNGSTADLTGNRMFPFPPKSEQGIPVSPIEPFEK